MAKLISEYKYLAVEADPNIEGDTDGYIVYREPTNEEWNEYQKESARGLYLSHKPNQEVNGITKMQAAQLKLAQLLFIRTEGLVNKEGNAAGINDIPDRMLIEGVGRCIIDPRKNDNLVIKN